MTSLRIAIFISFVTAGFLIQCNESKQRDKKLSDNIAKSESIRGKSAYLNSPYVTAGDRVYMVGHQNGLFPDLGWHVTAEMGGIWDHPIKLLDGFTATVITDGLSVCLTEADTFVNYSFANKHVFVSGLKDLEIERFQFVPDGKEAVVVEFSFANKGKEVRQIKFNFNGYTDLRPVWLGEKTGMSDGKDSAAWEGPSNSWITKDSLDEWYVMFGSEIISQSHQQNIKSCEYKPAGRGCQASLTYDIEIPPKSTVSIPIIISGSYQSAAKVKETFTLVRKNTVQLLNDKKQRYAELARKTRLNWNFVFALPKKK